VRAASAERSATLAEAVSHDLPATRDTARPALRPTETPARAGGGSAPQPRWGRRLLGGALLVATIGLGSCHAFWVALLA
jgi:hypothetical protein